MASREIFFKPAHNILDGFYIPVRNDWNYQIVKRHLTSKEKKLYEQQFGEKIISDEEFYNWWKSIRSELTH